MPVKLCFHETSSARHNRWQKILFFKFEGVPADIRKTEVVQACVPARGVDVHAASEYGVRR